MENQTEKFDVSNLSLEELETLHKDVTKAISTFKERQRLEAIAALETKAKEMGFSLSDLTGLAKRKGGGGYPKFVHPENPALTWTGRGRQPAWIKEGLAAGKSLKDFAIKV